ncbi:MAG TPA: UDP-N-acetylglucosamine 2-epimerase (non-hydrolyzing) [Anaerolineae bacterium]|nr:UDP-N-acetylglucosamine 2-epimerase (non-hydrolyzing) [Anaerolineae bacterium]
MRVIHVVGARPNFMKIAPVIEEMARYPEQFQQVLVHTGQHYDDNMSRVFFEDLRIPKPDLYLGVGSGSHAEQTARIMVEFEKVVSGKRPDLVVVVGDVNSTMACAIVAAKLWVPVAHVEAGLRSFDRRMPEEINRLVTDALSDYLFTTCRDANENLRQEGIPEEKIFFAGNVMIDTLLKHKERASDLGVPEQYGLEIGKYAVVTLHRPSNVDEPTVLKGILEALGEIAKRVPVIFPAHPRTQQRIKEFGLADLVKSSRLPVAKSSSREQESKAWLVEPLGYLEFLGLMADARLVLTDSGGIQEETTILGVPCLTLRENTERPITVAEGTNLIVGSRKERIVAEALRILESGGKAGRVPELWDGRAAERIVQVIRQKAAER